MGSCLLIDADPQGPLTLWLGMRGSDPLVLENGVTGFKDTIEQVRRDGVEWVFVDTPPLVSEEGKSVV